MGKELVKEKRLRLKEMIDGALKEAGGQNKSRA